jgi:hypothetical protein
MKIQILSALSFTLVHALPASTSISAVGPQSSICCKAMTALLAMKQASGKLTGGKDLSKKYDLENPDTAHYFSKFTDEQLIARLDELPYGLSDDQGKMGKEFEPGSHLKKMRKLEQEFYEKIVQYVDLSVLENGATGQCDADIKKTLSTMTFVSSVGLITGTIDEISVRESRELRERPERTQ